MKAYLLFLLILLPSTLALIEPVEYKGVDIKFYNKEINQTDCLAKLDAIPVEYFEGLEIIAIYDKPHHYKGIYQINYILLYEGCDQFVIIHELAHHKQYREGKKWIELLRHRGNFTDYFYEIKAKTEYNNLLKLRMEELDEKTKQLSEISYQGPE